MAMADGTGYLINLIYYASADTLKMVVQIPVPCLMALTSLLGTGIHHYEMRNFLELQEYFSFYKGSSINHVVKILGMAYM